MHNPGPQHYEALMNILKYLVKNPHLGILFQKSASATFTGCSDSDWAGDEETRRSTTCNIVRHGLNVIHFSSKLQKSISLSTKESETNALTSEVKTVNKFRRIHTALLQFLLPTTKRMEASPILVDNQATILSSQPIPRRKYIDVKYHFIRQEVENKNVTIHKVPGSENPADLGTKPLSSIKIAQYCEALNLMSNSKAMEIMQTQ
jgi:hypothetical protein